MRAGNAVVFCEKPTAFEALHPARGGGYYIFVWKHRRRIAVWSLSMRWRTVLDELIGDYLYIQ
ncbi:MAG: hypothetical protein KKD69_02730, partial [Euryarchaeota archaeon]|nr:hypothetical protein [Euryarchaeota archaeon]MCG2727692.1 hypothetical protein [Candidatus Methanoperedenaceae archaeon]